MSTHKGIKAVIGISSWHQTRTELRALAKKSMPGNACPQQTKDGVTSDKGWGHFF